MNTSQYSPYTNTDFSLCWKQGERKKKSKISNVYLVSQARNSYTTIHKVLFFFPTLTRFLTYRHFQARLNCRKKCLLALSCPSLRLSACRSSMCPSVRQSDCQHVSERPQLDGSHGNLVLEMFMNIYRENPNLVKTRYISATLLEKLRIFLCCRAYKFTGKTSAIK